MESQARASSVGHHQVYAGRHRLSSCPGRPRRVVAVRHHQVSGESEAVRVHVGGHNPTIATLRPPGAACQYRPKTVGVGHDNVTKRTLTVALIRCLSAILRSKFTFSASTQILTGPHARSVATGFITQLLSSRLRTAGIVMTSSRKIGIVAIAISKARPRAAYR